ncbi:MAG: FAD-binding oxidoreductase [Pseudomonadota bacterium]
MTTDALPKDAEVVVIGGGVVGASIAYFLAKRGIAVALCEKGRIAGEQSSRNWGWIRQQGRDVREVPAILESLKIWRGLEAELDEDVGFRNNGVLYLAESEAQLAEHDDWLALAKTHGIDSRRLGRAEVGELLGHNDPPWKGGLYTPSDCQAEPAKAVPAIARGVEKLGGTVITNCAVRGLQRVGGRVSGVVTERGEIACHAVVCAAGAWASLFNGNLGFRLPQLKVRGSVGRTEPAPQVTEGALSDSHLSLRRRQDGGYTMAYPGVTQYDIVPESFRYLRAFLPLIRHSRRGLKLRLGRRFAEELGIARRWQLDETTPFEQVRVLDPKPNERFLAQALVEAGARFPSLRGIKFVETWAGMIDVTPDAIPVISPVEALPGYFIAAGFSGHGFGLGPGAGLLMAQLVAGETPAVDMTPFRYSRFIDGTKIVPGHY